MKFYTQDSHLALLCRAVGFSISVINKKAKFTDGEERVVKMFEISTRKKMLEKIFNKEVKWEMK